ncbi:hypothetical protein ACQPTN_40150 [Bradyrhizobium sp. 13971]
MTTTISTQDDGLLQRNEKAKAKQYAYHRPRQAISHSAPRLDREHRRMPKPALEAVVGDRQFADRENALTLA